MAVHTSKKNIGAVGCFSFIPICLNLALFTVPTKCADTSELRQLNVSVNLTLMTDLVFTNTVSFRCTSNNGNGTWFVFKGSNRDVLFQDKAIGSGYKESKFTMDYFSKDSIQISIRKFDENDIDVYMCSHKDKSSNQLIMGTIEHYQTSVNLTLMTDLVLENTVKLRCTSNTGNGTWFVYKGSGHDVMFQDKALGSAYNKSKFKMEYIPPETIEIEIRSFDKTDIDVYMCSHKDKSSKNLDLRNMEIYEPSVNLTLMTNLVSNSTVKLRCTSNNGYGTWFMYKGTSHDVLFQDEVIGSGYNTSKYSIQYLSQDSLEMSIHQFSMNDIDEYMCSHNEKSSNLLDLRMIKNITEIPSDMHETKTHAVVIATVVTVIIIAIVVIVICIIRRRQVLSRRRQNELYMYDL
ncbi:uncharacterized protein LOC143058279 [Mytilus galloprovincialis]|uniref:uncharacterized protein LOC143058279 n=1 Tax=Mytilus galloprovincialis TaxID=29158 RepID=UPI003F7C8B38